MVDTKAVCEAASDWQPTQTMAWVLSGLFLAYLSLSLLVARHAVMSASTPPGG